MNITQHDVAQVDTVTLKRLAVMYDEVALEDSELTAFAGLMSRALVGVIRERRSLELTAEAELMNDDRPGKLLGPGDDPVADALRELRGECP
ncbi:hypothetical protein [Nocardioides zhouii]|uniref:Uncharacterized protein n=1 Tax=Nocardioides zhouii TaxID=1168729 RepID=A0A4Q2T992_9ACTN|nr:hypothetical protein [Nocardioides zhouii]RYC14561.1 hypothetical protein EUA94_00070 [Nocardioides zhouii]